jgi:uncharacterized protein with FMN-binding domain
VKKLIKILSSSNFSGPGRAIAWEREPTSYDNGVATAAVKASNQTPGIKKQIDCERYASLDFIKSPDEPEPASRRAKLLPQRPSVAHYTAALLRFHETHHHPGLHAKSLKA